MKQKFLLLVHIPLLFGGFIVLPIVFLIFWGVWDFLNAVAQSRAVAEAERNQEPAVEEPTVN